MATQHNSGTHHSDVTGVPPGRSRACTNSSATDAMSNGAVASSSINGAQALNDGPMSAPQDLVEVQNARALEVLDRVQQKLTGHDFKPSEELDVISQVSKLIIEATKLENLCQHYIGWCSFW